uniref:Uncharacterized protein n=1 Tax=Ficedula albicollis TaxID=59894 RepID=A0A803VD91_FICAL
KTKQNKKGRSLIQKFLVISKRFMVCISMSLIYTKICGLQKVFQKNVIQDVIILKKRHYKQQITITGVACLLKHQSTPVSI